MPILKPILPDLFTDIQRICFETEMPKEKPLTIDTTSLDWLLRLLDLCLPQSICGTFQNCVCINMVCVTCLKLCQRHSKAASRTTSFRPRTKLPSVAPPLSSCKSIQSEHALAPEQVAKHTIGRGEKGLSCEEKLWNVALLLVECRPCSKKGKQLHPRGGCFFPECVAKGSRLTLGGLGVESCSRSVVSMFATVRNRSQPFATVRSRTLRRCHWGKLLQVTFHGCVPCQFATLFHCDLHENDMSRKKRDAFRCTGAVV